MPRLTRWAILPGSACWATMEARLAAAMDVAKLGFYEVANGDRVSYLDPRARKIIGASEADEQAGRMEAHEAMILRRFGIDDPYA